MRCRNEYGTEIVHVPGQCLNLGFNLIATKAAEVLGGGVEKQAQGLAPCFLRERDRISTVEPDAFGFDLALRDCVEQASVVSVRNEGVWSNRMDQPSVSDRLIAVFIVELDVLGLHLDHEQIVRAS